MCDLVELNLSINQLKTESEEQKKTETELKSSKIRSFQIEVKTYY